MQGIHTSQRNVPSRHMRFENSIYLHIKQRIINNTQSYRNHNVYSRLTAIFYNIDKIGTIQSSEWSRDQRGDLFQITEVSKRSRRKFPYWPLLNSEDCQTLLGHHTHIHIMANDGHINTVSFIQRPTTHPLFPGALRFMSLCSKWVYQYSMCAVFDVGWVSNINSR